MESRDLNEQESKIEKNLIEKMFKNVHEERKTEEKRKIFKNVLN